METNCINTTYSSYSKYGEESFGRIKRKYKKPIITMGYWEAMVKTK